MTAEQIAKTIFECGLAPHSDITEEWIVDEIEKLSIKHEIEAHNKYHEILKKFKGWIVFDGNEEIFEIAAKNNCQCKFDDGTECNFNDELPKAELTHFKIKI